MGCICFRTVGEMGEREKSELIEAKDDPTEVMQEQL
jgi:hypothetical protein